jgi:hypothetical protein
MKQVSNLFDALRNEKFAIAVKDDNGIRYYGVEGAGREWAQWANAVDTKSLESTQLPAGVIQGPFKNSTDVALKSLINSLGYSEPQNKNTIDSKSYSYKSSYSYPNESRVPAVMDTPISHFTTDQYTSAVDYKALVIRTQIKEGSFLLEARANNYAFDFQKSMYNTAPSKAEIKSLRQRIDNNLGRSTERRLGLKLKNAIIETGGRKNIGVIYGLETKSLGDSFEQKSLGQRIGGGSRLGRRAGRAAFARFDPKAWDGDGDGIVQEGTPFQRPAVPGVNDRSTGGKVNVDEATAAWEKLGTGKRGQVAKRTVVSKPAVSRQRAKPKPGLASKGPKTEAGVNSEIAKQVTDKIEDVLYKRDTMSSFSAFIDGLGPDGAQELTAEQVFDIKEAIQLYDNDDYDMDDLRSSIGAVVNRKKPAPKSNQSGMRSRVSTARTQRQVEGLASRSSASKKKAVKKAIPGRDKVSEKDGQIWDSLTDEQKDLAAQQAEQAYKDLMDEIKTKDSDWWSSFLQQNATVKARQKIDADGNEWNRDSRIAGEAFTSYQLAMEDAIDNMKVELSGIESQIAKATDAEAKKKLENKAKRVSKEIDRAQQVIDDLLTFDQMQKSDDWSLLEHLHPENRQKILGTKVPKAQQGNYQKVFGDSKPPMKLTDPSTIFEKDLTAEKPRFGDKTDRRLADFARRITRPNPQRAERRRLRKAGKGTAVEDIESASDQASPLKRRIRRAKNQFLLNVKGKRNPEDIESKVNSSLKKNNHAFKREDGSIKIDDAAIDAMTIMTDAFKVKKKKGAKGEAVVTNAGARKSLVGLWNANSFNATPVWIREDEIPEMIEQGWIPIQRGFGKDTYADIWLNSPKRHVTGEGAAVVGAGEYWAYTDSSGWDGYVKGNSGVVGMVKRDRIVESSRINAMRADHSTISKAVDSYITGAGSGGRWDKELSAQELVQEIEETLSKMIPADSGVWNTEWGKVYQGVFQWMKTVDPKDTEKQRKAVEVLKLLNRLGDADSTIHAGFLGYDGVDFGLGDGRIVMHNRSAMLAVNEPMSLVDIKKAAKGEKVKEVAEKTKVKKPSRKGSSSSTKIKGSSKSLDNKSWKQVGGQGGSQPGAEFEDPSGKKFYVKKQKSKLHAENEVLMSKLYEKLGVRAAKNSEGTAHIAGQSPGPGVFSSWLDGSKSVNHSAEVRNPRWKKSVQDTFVANAWLANWDGTGNGDNIKMGADGEAYIIDTGGAGLFRARGDSKGASFGPIVGEMESLRDPGVNSLGAMYFSDIPAQEIARQVAAIGALSDADIRKMVNDVVTDSVEAKKLVDTLIARRDYLVQTWGTGIKK